MKVIFHVKAATTRDSNDGVIEMWRQREGEASPTKFHEKFDCDIPLPTSGPAGFVQGYIFGWANEAYSVDTEFLIDHVVLSETAQGVGL